MKRETKVGIVVAGSFLALVGGVFAVKHFQKPTETPTTAVVAEEKKPATAPTTPETTPPAAEPGITIPTPAAPASVVVDPTPTPMPGGLTLPTPDATPMPMITISPTPIVLPGAETPATPVVGTPTIPTPTPSAKPAIDMEEFLARGKDARGILGSGLMTKSTLLAKAIRTSTGPLAMAPTLPSASPTISLDVGTPPAATPKVDPKPMPPEISIAPPPMPMIDVPPAPKPMSDPKPVDLPGGPITLPGAPAATPKTPDPAPTINVPKPPDIGLPASPATIPATPKIDSPTIGLPSAPMNPPAPPMVPMTPAPPTNVTPPVAVPDPNSVRSADVRLDSYEEEWYRCQNDDTLEKISQKFFYTPKYGQALRLYNLDRQNGEVFRAENPQLRAGIIVRVPPARVLEWKYPAALGLKPASASSPAGTTVSNPSPGATLGTAAPGRADTSNANEYKVERPNMTLRDIAKEKLGNSDQWQRIFRLNRWLNPQEPVPEGTMIFLPRP